MSAVDASLERTFGARARAALVDSLSTSLMSLMSLMSSTTSSLMHSCERSVVRFLDSSRNSSSTFGDNSVERNSTGRCSPT